MNIIRQGDVLLVPVDSKSGKVVERENGRIVLAHGEVTGHAHAIDSNTAVLFEDEDQWFLETNEPTVLKHEEHGAVVIPTGIWEVKRQREYTPEEIRRVAD